MASKKSTPRKTSKKKTAKPFYPVVRGSELGSTNENAAVRILDTPRNLSVLNRRLYRYGRCYSVKVEMDAGQTQTVEVYALRNDWAVHQSLKMAYDVYRHNTDDERKALSGNQLARWEDFRVDNGVGGATNPLLPVLHDALFADSIKTQGTFDLSTVVDTAQVERTFTWGAAAATEYSILAEYDLKGNAQTSPESDTNDGPYANIKNELDQTMLKNLQEDGATPPYDPTGVNASSPWVRVATLAVGAAGDQKLSTGYFDAPCGVVVCVGNNDSWNSNALRFEVKAGEYKGVHAPSMLE
jgi:hypothetical protein